MRTRRLLGGFSAAFIFAAVFTVLAAEPECHTANCAIWQPWDIYWWIYYCYLPPCPEIITEAVVRVVSALV